MKKNKNKIFTAEDFDKEPRTHNTKRRYIYRLLGTIVLVTTLGIIGYFFFSKPDSGGQTPVVEEEQSTFENISDSSDTSRTDRIAVEESEKTEQELSDNSKTNESVAPVEYVKSADVTTKDSAESSDATVNVSDDVETEALKVIRGDYGVGQERKDKLGEKYQPIQNRVNELKREGLF